jgi:hypothetical protein
MKKLILLFVACTFIFTACSDDDSPAVDPLIGTWTYYKYFDNGVEGALNPCDLKDTLVFNEDGSYSDTTYFTESNGDCAIDDSGSGTWVNNGNGSYTRTVGVEEFTTDITFEGNTFSFEEVDSFEQTDGSDIEKIVYIRN